jgi:predicted enzyme related to lactoylglutathione lyase
MNRMGNAPSEEAPVNAYVCTVQVDSYDQTHDRIIKAGGTVALPKQAIPGMAWQGYYKDTEGNIFGVHQPDKDAK